MIPLSGRVAVVTGASRGVGRGLATVLAESGAIVCGTGRTIQQADPPSSVVRITCDHTDGDHELRPHNVAVVSLYPGLVRTEAVMAAAAYLDLSNSESPEFIGRAVAALARDSDVIRHSGRWLVAAALAAEYGFSDIDGASPRPLVLDDIP